MTHIHHITCPSCDGRGRRQYEVIPNHPSGRTAWEECSACRGDGMVIDLSICHECGERLADAGERNVVLVDLEGGGRADLAICDKCLEA